MLTHNEIGDLPIDFALEELIRARCFLADEKFLTERVARQSQIARLGDEQRKLNLPGDIGYELERDPRYAKA